MADPMRIRATAQADGSVEVRVLMSHEMETGQRRDGAGKLVPAHYISNVTVTHAGKTVLSAEWGPAVSKNPYLQFRFQGGKKGDEITVTWLDNKNESRTDKATIN
jgi:sulfur-oxidizing protein SoxZ